MEITFENIVKYFQMTFPMYLIFVLLMLIYYYLYVKIRNYKGRSIYTSEEYLIFGPFNKGDIFSFVFILLWAPIVFTIAFFLSLSEQEQLQIDSPLMVVFFLTIPVGGSVIYHVVNKREQNKYK